MELADKIRMIAVALIAGSVWFNNTESLLKLKKMITTTRKKKEK